MKHFFIAICALGMFACGQKNQNSSSVKETAYGQPFDAGKAVAIDAAFAEFEKTGKPEAIVSGSISAVCKGEGCWYNIKHGNKEQYTEFGEKFTIPKDCEGKETFASGYFYRDTTTVDALKAEAKEAGKTAAEIEAIKEPVVNISFRANGLIIK
jgi:hypothetical protein